MLHIRNISYRGMLLTCKKTIIRCQYFIIKFNYRYCYE